MVDLVRGGLILKQAYYNDVLVYIRKRAKI